MLILTLIFLVLFIIGHIMWFSEGFVVICTIGFCVCFFLSIFLSVHLSMNISIVRMEDSLINVEEQAIEELDRQMEELSSSIPQNSLFNNDSPYRSLIELRGKRIEMLTNVKQRIQESKINISSMKLGLFRDIVWVFGDK